LRWRAVLAFALTALVLSSVLTSVAYLLVRTSLVDARESTAMDQAYTNARLVRNRLREAEPDVTSLLASLQIGAEGNALLRYNGNWFSSSVSLDESALPASLRDAVGDGDAARQLHDTDDGPRLAVGLPIVESSADYFELTELGEVEAALDRLSSRLAIATAVATLTGAVVGASITGTVFRPLRRTATVAQEISDGEVDRRLQLSGDPDLDPLAESFNNMVDELEDRIRRESRFASDASHELRGPLTALAAAVSVVQRRHDELPAAVADAVDALEDQVVSFNQLVLDLLEISRFEAGTAQLALRNVDILEFVRAVLSEREDDLLIVSDLRAPVRLDVDARRLQQVLGNLLDNAANYAGGATAITLAQPNPDLLRITVDDRGPGVPEADRDKIFSRFERGTAGTAPGAAHGTGLGLALARDHVALHGGRLWVCDAPDGGARFVIDLPAESP
jgi:signal transduction histidine kinase